MGTGKYAQHANHQENTNKKKTNENNGEISPHTCCDNYHQKEQNNKC